MDLIDPFGSEAAVEALAVRIARLPLFSGLTPEALIALTARMQWLGLPGGMLLFDQDDVSDAMYVLMHGRLAVSRRERDGSFKLIAHVAPGESVGEMGLITGETRSARVEAQRDSEMLRLSRADFETLIARHPQAMLALSRLLFKRYGPNRAAAAPPRCIALLPLTPGLPLHAFARSLCRALGVDADRAMIDAAAGQHQETSWFGEREARSPWLLYVGDGGRDWQARCLHQSDRVLWLANAQQPVTDGMVLPTTSPHVSQHLLLHSAGDVRRGDAARWRAAFPELADQWHIRGDADIARLARMLGGRLLGLVLSGGGARGFAHLGVVRALREAGLVIDQVGGTSIGAILGAGVAADWSDAELTHNFRRAFVGSNPLSDWTLPLVALRRGAKVAQLLRDAFGELAIEDLLLPYFAVSTDLAVGRLVVHDRGTLWPALRASCAIPGVLPPVFSEGRILVDGGVVENLPVAEMRRRLLGEIVAVDVSGGMELASGLEETELPPWWQQLPEIFGARKRPSILKLLLRAGMVNSDATRARRRGQTKLSIRPPLEGIDLLAWQSFDRTVALGYEQAQRALEKQRDCVDALLALQKGL